MSVLNVDNYNERQQRSVQRILNQIDRCNSRTELHYARVRRHERRPYRGLISVFVPTPLHPSPLTDGQLAFTAWSYSLSQGGVGFITPEAISSERVQVGVHLPNGTIRWLEGEIVRRRPIPDEEFYDYGVSFRALHQPPAGG